MTLEERAAAAWLALAREDFARASRQIEADPVAVAFHAQQAAEKALKAFLAMVGERHGKTHDLSTLALLAAKYDASFASLAPTTERVTIFATIFRYPHGDEIAMPSPKDVADAVQLCEITLELVEKKLGTSIVSASNQLLMSRKKASSEIGREAARILRTEPDDSRPQQDDVQFRADYKDPSPGT